jgi:hypothetical protein
VNRRSTPVTVAALVVAGLVLGGCGGGGSHVIGPGVGTTTTTHLRASSTSTTSGRARTGATTTTAPVTTTTTPTPVTSALTAQIASELNQLDQSLAGANGDLSSAATAATTGGK